jgi:1,6-anhydro-N-acetylmuramate kinase
VKRLLKSKPAAGSDHHCDQIFTAATIIRRAIRNRQPGVDRIWRRRTQSAILGHLAAFLPKVAIGTSADYGVDVDAKEAVAFAILANGPGGGARRIYPRRRSRRPVI